MCWHRGGLAQSATRSSHSSKPPRTCRWSIVSRSSTMTARCGVNGQAMCNWTSSSTRYAATSPTNPSGAERAEFAALLSGDKAAVAAIGLERIAVALAGLFNGLTPQDFTTQVRAFMASAKHNPSGRPLRSVTYQPMLELLDELRGRDFTVGIVTGGGTEFVRAISDDLYAVPAELVVGTLIDYEFTRDEQDRPVLRRTATMLGEANEGPAKVTNIQTQLGRRPILAAGNSGGDREMLEWALAA